MSRAPVAPPGPAGGVAEGEVLRARRAGLEVQDGARARDRGRGPDVEKATLRARSGGGGSSANASAPRADEDVHEARARRREQPSARLRPHAERVELVAERLHQLAAQRAVLRGASTKASSSTPRCCQSPRSVRSATVRLAGLMAGQPAKPDQVLAPAAATPCARSPAWDRLLPRRDRRAVRHRRPRGRRRDDDLDDLLRRAGRVRAAASALGFYLFFVLSGFLVSAPFVSAFVEGRPRPGSRRTSATARCGCCPRRGSCSRSCSSATASRGASTRRAARDVHVHRRPRGPSRSRRSSGRRGRCAWT